MAIDIFDDDVFAALKAFMHEILPELANNDIRQGQQNDVPMPVGPDFVILIPTDRASLATTVRNYAPTDSQRLTTLSTQVGCQINFYGPNATDHAQIFAQLFRDLYGCDYLRPFGVQPLWCDDGRQMPLVDSEQQYTTRWLVHALMQINPTVSTSQQFADTVGVIIVEAD